MLYYFIFRPPKHGSNIQMRPIKNVIQLRYNYLIYSKSNKIGINGIYIDKDDCL